MRRVKRAREMSKQRPKCLTVSDAVRLIARLPRLEYNVFLTPKDSPDMSKIDAGESLDDVSPSLSCTNFVTLERRAIGAAAAAAAAPCVVVTLSPVTPSTRVTVTWTPAAELRRWGGSPAVDAVITRSVESGALSGSSFSRPPPFERRS